MVFSRSMRGRSETLELTYDGHGLSTDRRPLDWQSVVIGDWGWGSLRHQRPPEVNGGHIR